MATAATTPVPERHRPGSGTAAPARPRGRLIVEAGASPAVLDVRKEITRLGRSPAADLRLDNASVSPRHAILVRRGHRVRILDDRSRCGVYVNGRRVDDAELRDLDVIALGTVVVRYRAAT